MNDSVLNTSLETKYRLLLLISVLPVGQYKQLWLSAVDFLTIYGAAFDYEGKNLHGDSKMKFTEYAVRIWNIRDALHELVVHGWVKAIPTPEGYLYQLTQTGKMVAKEFSTTYAAPYRKNASNCYDRYGHFTGEELDAMIRSIALAYERKGGFA